MNWDHVRDCCHERAPFDFHGSSGATVTAEGAIEGWKAEAVTFPDARREILRAFGNEDLVCVEIRESGTHKGPLEHAGKVFAPTGKRFQILVCAVFQIREHKIAEASVYYDPRDHLVQLGIS